MDNYTIRVKKSAFKELKSLPKKDVIRISNLISGLSENPRPSGCKKLKGYDNLWRIRSGNYRIIYSVEDQILIVEVLEVVDRKDAY